MRGNSVGNESSWYRVLEHAGDIAVLVRAPTLPGLYDAASRALFDMILDVRTVEAREAVAVVIEDAVDGEDLLVRYLSELLFLHDARGWLFNGARVRHVGGGRVDGDALGEPFDSGRHRIERQVKAVTYHNLLVSEDREGWSARFVLDL
jgi:SHS2 domain-containing protein